jgi:hypothetical protein
MLVGFSIKFRIIENSRKNEAFGIITTSLTGMIASKIVEMG